MAPQAHPGAPGVAGIEGLSAYELSEFTGTLQEWLDSLKGETGARGHGRQGTPGPATAHGRARPALRAPRATTAPRVLPARLAHPGRRGLSAYELSEFIGTVEEWIESLKGADGATARPALPATTAPPGTRAPATTAPRRAAHGADGQRRRSGCARCRPARPALRRPPVPPAPDGVTCSLAGRA